MAILGSRTRESKLRRFVNWCLEQGVQGDKVELALFDGLGVGVKATQKIQVSLALGLSPI